MKDEAVARRLGVSTRTMRRLVAATMDELGAQSRFEAGIEAARRGFCPVCGSFLFWQPMEDGRPAPDAAAVAFAGIIGFIGLVGPHIARMLVGEDQRYFVPASMAAGAAGWASLGVIPALLRRTEPSGPKMRGADGADIADRSPMEPSLVAVG